MKYVCSALEEDFSRSFRHRKKIILMRILVKYAFFFLRHSIVYVYILRFFSLFFFFFFCLIVRHFLSWKVSTGMSDFSVPIVMCITRPCSQRYADLVAAISVVSLVDREGPASCGR